MAGLASIESQLAAIDARLAVLNPARVQAGLPVIARPAYPKLDRENHRTYADAKHNAKIRLALFRKSLDKQIKAYGSILPTSQGGGRQRRGGATESIPCLRRFRPRRSGRPRHSHGRPRAVGFHGGRNWVGGVGDPLFVMASPLRLVAVRPTNFAARSNADSPAPYRPIAAKPAGRAQVAAAAADARTAAQVAAIQNKSAIDNARITAAATAAAAKLVKPQTYTATGALDFGVSTLRGLGVLPAATDTGDPTRLGSGSGAPAQTSAPGASSALGSLLPLLIVGVAAFFFLKK